jgi:voltage-gated potassium channel
MKDKRVTEPPEHIGIFQVLILVLSILVLGALLADTVLALPTEISRVFKTLDALVCIILLGDFAVRFYRAESKAAFIKWGWIDLVASIPYVQILRWGRLVRILKVVRVLRALWAAHRIATLFFKNLFQTGVASIVLASILLLLFSSIGVLIVERPNPDGNIKTAEDAIWWSVNTITTVGCPDKYPTTSEGRLLGMVTMISGVGLFGGLSGLVASLFINSKEKKIETDENKILRRLDRLEEKIDRLGRS